MRASWLLFIGLAGLGLTEASCGNGSSSGGDLFVPPTTSGSQASTGSGGSGTTTGAAGSSTTTTTSVGAGGSGTGGQPAGAGGTSGPGSGGATAVGGSAGSGGTPAGAGGTASGTGGAAGTAGAAGAAGARPDGGAGADAGQADAGPLHPIRCGATTCSAPGQFCCIPPNAAQLPRCVAVGGACPAMAARLACDDRTDCGDIGQICCAELGPNGVLAACSLPINCNMQFQGQELCDPTRMATCMMLGSQCLADNQSIVDGYPYCH